MFSSNVCRVPVQHGLTIDAGSLGRAREFEIEGFMSTGDSLIHDGRDLLFPRTVSKDRMPNTSGRPQQPDDFLAVEQT